MKQFQQEWNLDDICVAGSEENIRQLGELNWIPLIPKTLAESRKDEIFIFVESEIPGYRLVGLLFYLY